MQILPRLDELPESILGLLAWQWHVDFYELAKTVEAKREVVKGAIAWHMKKGTAWAILKALDMFGVKGTYINWYDVAPRGEPYTFAIDAELTDAYWKRADWEDPARTIRRAILESKAQRSWMSSLYIHIDRELSQDIRIGIAVAQAPYQEVKLEQPTSGDASLTIRVGLAMSQGLRQRVRLKQATSGSVKAALNIGMAASQGSYQKIGMKQPTSGNARARMYSGAAFASSIYTKIKMAA